MLNNMKERYTDILKKMKNIGRINALIVIKWWQCLSTEHLQGVFNIFSIKYLYVL